MTWYSKNLGGGMEAYVPTRKIQEAWFSMCCANPEPMKNVALFQGYDMDTNTVIVYFSPEAKYLADLFSANPCNKPARHGLCLLAALDAIRALQFTDFAD
jgi:hypothetical protein